MFTDRIPKSIPLNDAGGAASWKTKLDIINNGLTKFGYKKKKSLSVIWSRNGFDNATVKECTQKQYSICKSPNLVIFTVILLISLYLMDL